MATISAISGSANIMPILAGYVNGVMDTAKPTLIQSYDVGNIKVMVPPTNNLYSSTTTFLQPQTDSMITNIVKPINPIKRPNQGIWKY